jgi:proteasome lid subunit RPN8/RPN11
MPLEIPVNSHAFGRSLENMIPGKLMEKIRYWCEKAYPKEACGLVVGQPVSPDSKSPFSQSDRVVFCKNIQDHFHKISPEKYPDSAAEAYMMDPAELLHILSEMEKRDEVLKAIFHSHPDSEAEFSSADCDHAIRFLEGRSLDVSDERPSHFSAAQRPHEPSPAPPKPVYPGVFQIIVSVIHGIARDARFFLWSDSLARFVEKR